MKLTISSALLTLAMICSNSATPTGTTSTPSSLSKRWGWGGWGWGDYAIVPSPRPFYGAGWAGYGGYACYYSGLFSLRQ
jgi:hypothetical protein